MSGVVIEAGVVTGYVIAWAVRKARRAAGRLDGEVDAAIDAGLDKLHEVVAGKLIGHPVLNDLEEEAAATAVGDSHISELTRQQVELAVTAAAGKDDAFARAVTELVAAVRAGEQAGGQSVLGHGGVTVAGDVDIRADHGAAAAWNIGTVTIGRTSGDPQGPGRSRD